MYRWADHNVRAVVGRQTARRVAAYGPDLPELGGIDRGHGGRRSRHEALLVCHHHGRKREHGSDYYSDPLHGFFPTQRSHHGNGKQFMDHCL
jgi:hypothetical protein